MLDARKIKSFVLSEKSRLADLFFVFVCFSLFYFFPAKGSFQNVLKTVFFFLVLPIAYVKIVLKKNLADYGLNLKNKRAGIFWGAFSLFAALAVSYFLYNFTSFRASYKLPLLIIDNFWIFLAYELLLVNLFSFSFVLISLGLLLFSLKKIGFWSAFSPFVLFFFTVVLSRDWSWQSVPMLVLILLGGLTAWKTKSFLYSYFSILLFSLLFDAYVISTINR